MKRFIFGVAPVLVLFFLSGAGLGHLSSGSSSDGVVPPNRSILLRAEDGRFVRNDEENPEVTVQAGQVVQFVFVNTDDGVRHTFAVPSQSDEVLEASGGERVSLRVRFETPGTYRYICPTHEPFMSGVIRVLEEKK
jgi:plastocyanin